jgi:hypothetical protein
MTKNKHTRTNPTPKLAESSPPTAVAASGGDRSGFATTLKSNSKLTSTNIATSLKGTPLESLAEVVVSLPKQISTLIKDKSTLMVSFFRECKKREASLNLYNKEIVNKDTGDAVEY